MERRKYPPQKLVKMTEEDEAKLLEMTQAVVKLQQKHEPDLLGHQLATTSHVVRLLIRRAYEEFKANEAGKEDTGLIQLMLAYGAMRDGEPPNGYGVHPYK